jgi:RNA polymerase sigma-70 factor (ECF subfamily)
LILVPLELAQQLSMPAIKVALVGGAVWLAVTLLGELVALRVVRALPPNAVFSIRLGPRGLRLTAARGSLSIDGVAKNIAAADPAGGSVAMSQDGVGGTDDPQPPAPTSWEEFVKANHAELLGDTARICLHVGLSQGCVEDVYQEAVIGLAQSWARARTAAQGPRAYMGGIIKKKALDLMRGRCANDRFNSQAVPLADEVAGRLSTWISAEDEVIHIHEIEALLQAVRKLPKRQREVITLVELDGYSIEDAAKELGIKSHAVRQALHKAMKKLRARLNNDRRGR